MLSMRRFAPWVDATAVTVLRFAVLASVVGGAALIGVDGFYVGLTANAAVTLLAVTLVSRRRLWRQTGLTRLWRSPWAALALLPLLAEALSWASYGTTVTSPGLAPWSLTLLLTGVNEELISRGVILTRLGEAYRRLPAVTLTASLFGLQHLSALALTGRGTVDVLQNVLLSGCYGFALAAFQLRYRWLWPLILIHATADWTTIFADRLHPTALIVAIHAGLLAYGALLLRLPEPSRQTDNRGVQQCSPSQAGWP